MGSLLEIPEILVLQGDLSSMCVSSNSNESFQTDTYKLQRSFDDVHQRPLRSLDLPQDWQALINRIILNQSSNGPSEVLVCGPKGSGKSTFCRWLSNALLSLPRSQCETGGVKKCILLLDLDPGQPEFSAPGEVTLLELRSWNLGVPFTHPTASPCNGEVVRGHYIGSISPKENSEYYLKAALDLLRASQTLLRSASASALVINCCGWIQGSGLELIKAIVMKATVTDIIYTSTAGPDEVVDTLATACKHTGSSLHQISSQPYQEGTRTASDLRALQTISYFHLAEPEAGNLRWDARPLTKRPPVVVPYAGPKQAIFAVILVGDEQKPELYPSIFDGSLVAVVLIENDNAIDGLLESTDASLDDACLDNVDDIDGELSSATVRGALSSLHHNTTSSPQTPTYLTHPSVRRTPTEIPYVPPKDHTVPSLPPAHTRSLGQALIRGIDISSQCFHLLTPIPVSELQELHKQNRKIVLVRGKLDTPTWAYKEEAEYERSRRRRKKRRADVEKVGEEEADMGEDEEDEEDEELRAWAKGQPWISVAEWGGKGRGKARRIRRDIRSRGQGDTRV